MEATLRSPSPTICQDLLLTPWSDITGTQARCQDANFNSEKTQRFCVRTEKKKQRKIEKGTQKATKETKKGTEEGTEKGTEKGMEQIKKE